MSQNLKIVLLKRLTFCIVSALAIFLTSLSLVGCDSDSRKSVAAKAPEKPSITVGDPILCSTLQELLNDDSIEFISPIVQPGKSLAREQVIAIQKSQLIVIDATHGGSKWNQQISLPRSKVVFSTFEILDQLIPVANLATHTHGPGQPHSHAGIVSETWLDPKLFAQQIRFVLDSLKEKSLIDSEQAAQAMEKWELSTSEINQRIEDIAKDSPRIHVLVDQAGLEYLGRRLGWEIDIVPFQLKLSDTSILKSELNAWRADHPQGLLIMLNEPTTPLADVFSDLKESYLQLDLSPRRFTIDTYPTSFNDLLNDLEAKLSP